MSTVYPGAIQDMDAGRGTSGQPLSNPNHITHHTTEDDTIEALQTKVGVDNSAVTSTIDYKLKSTSSVNPGHKHTLTSTAFTDVDTAGAINGDFLSLVGGVWSPVSTTAPDASTTVKGVVKLDTAPASPTDPIAVGDNSTRLPTQGENDALVGNNTDIAVGTGNKYVTQTGLQKSAEVYAVDSVGTDSYAITLSPVPTSYAAGMTVRFKAGTTNTGACTLNVNSLGAIAIKKNGSSDLADGDIVSGQVVTVVYDGTNFQIASPTATSMNYAVGTVAALSSPAAGNNDITITTGFTPRLIKLYYFVQGHSNSVTNPFGNTYIAAKGVATYNGTTLVYNNVSISSPTTTDDAGFSTSSVNDVVPNDPTNTGAPSAGDTGGAFSAVNITLSVNAVSSTGFTIRRVTDSSNAGARAKISYEVYE